MTTKTKKNPVLYIVSAPRYNWKGRIYTYNDEIDLSDMTKAQIEGTLSSGVIKKVVKNG